MKLLTFASRLNCFHGVFGQIKTVTPRGEIFLNFISGRKNVSKYVSKSGCKTEPWNCRVTNNININCPVGISHQKYRQVVALGYITAIWRLADNCAPRYDVCRYADIADSCAPNPDSRAPDPDNCAPEPDNCAPV